MVPYLPLNFYTTLSRNDNIIGFSTTQFDIFPSVLFFTFHSFHFLFISLGFIAGVELQSHHLIAWKNLAVWAVNLISVLWFFMAFISLVKKINNQMNKKICAEIDVYWIFWSYVAFYAEQQLFKINWIVLY